jgi:hypothetical protein
VQERHPNCGTSGWIRHQPGQRRNKVRRRLLSKRHLRPNAAPSQHRPPSSARRSAAVPQQIPAPRPLRRGLARQPPKPAPYARTRRYRRTGDCPRKRNPYDSRRCRCRCSHDKRSARRVFCNIFQFLVLACHRGIRSGPRGGGLALLPAQTAVTTTGAGRCSGTRPAAFAARPARYAAQNTSRPAPPRAPERTAEAAGPVAAQFTPTSAQLSIASLSVTGMLAIKNQTRTPVSGLILRSHMISAQDGQREAVAAFHSDRGAGSIQPLGDLAAGERIDATIEIRLPRTELSSFRWTEREFVAPIVLIHLFGSADGEPVEIQITQLIGREGTGQSDRMQPLPIDRGPKRFSGIAARPVFA